MKLSFFDMQKNHYPLEIDENASLQDLKDQFFESFNQNINNYKLVHNGREIKDNLRLSSLSIVDGSKIMILKQKKQEESKILDTPNFSQSISLNQQKPQISSKINFRKPTSSDPEIPKSLNSDIKPLQRLYRDLSNLNNEEIKFIDSTENNIDEKLNKLKMMGFHDELSKQALTQTNGNYEDAIAIILTQIEDFKYNLENANKFISKLVENPQWNFIVWEIANNPDQYDQFITDKFKEAPETKILFLVNKELFIEICKKKVVFKNKNRSNIEEISGQFAGQNPRINETRGMGSLNSSGSIWNSIDIEGQGGMKGKSGIGEVHKSSNPKDIDGAQKKDEDSSLSGSDISDLSDSDDIDE